MTVTIVTLPPRQVLRVQCHRCGHVWFYTGRSRQYAQCSHCRTTVSLYLTKEFDLETLEIYHPQTGPNRATNSEDKNAASADTITLECDYTQHE
jgi:predicted  nucleic acid-binding Zn-ribbon protein